LLPHWVPNAGIRLSADGHILTYTGDSGPGPDVVELARGASVCLAEATYVDAMPQDSEPYLTSARQAGRQATAAGAESLLLTHLWPGTDPQAAVAAAAAEYDGTIGHAFPGLSM
jgi:ribonuclease BN (tRNA processing enzyme)